MRYAIIENNTVVNVIVWDESNGPITEATQLQTIQSDTASIGDLYIDGQFIKPQTDTNDPGNTFEQ